MVPIGPAPVHWIVEGIHTTLAIYCFAITRTTVLLVFEGVLLAAVLGWIGDGYGAYHVVWFETASVGPWVERALFWNGLGVGIFHLTVAYMVYLHFARARRKVFWSWERFRLYLGKALPFLVATALPAFAWTDSATEAGFDRRPFIAGLFAAAGLFVGGVELLSHWNPGRHGWAQWLERHWNRPKSLSRVGRAVDWIPARLRGLPHIEKSPLDRQADGLYGVVLFVYALLAGATLVDSFVAIDASILVGLTVEILVLTFFLVRFPLWGAGLTFFALIAGYAVRPLVFEVDDFRLTTRWPWFSIPALVFALNLVFWLWYTARRWKEWGVRIGIVGAAIAALGIVLFTILRGWAVSGGWTTTALVVLVLVIVVLVPVLRGLLQRDGDRSVSYVAGMVFWAMLGGLLGWFGGGWAGVIRGDSGVTVLPAGLSACLLLAVVAAAYSLLLTYAGHWFYPVFLAIIAGFAVLSGQRPYSHEIEELGPEYRRADRINLAGDPALSKFNLAEYVADRAIVSRQLKDAEVLENWRRGLRDWTEKPPIVIVTCAGGASVSAIYTYHALVGLERAIPGFHRHIRILTGASGGMLGAAYYRAMLHRFYLERSRPDVAGYREGQLADFLETNKPGLAADFLSPILQGLAFKDTPMALVCPFGFWDDRGRRLERAWRKYTDGALDITFQTLRQTESDGRLPSLIFSPMIVEEGRPLLISTLDLDREFAVPDDVGYAPVRALELFKMFPQTAWNLRLGTAARLSSAFPFFSPAASLPTIPPRRVVDAGYLDNYGMSTALTWTRRATEFGWLQGRAARVVLIELRPYGTWTQSTLTEDELNHLVEGTERTAGLVPSFVDPFQELTSPPSGAGSARKAGMIARNAEQFELLQKRLDREVGKDYLVRVAFKGELLGVSLNWTLSNRERKQIETAVDSIFEPIEERPLPRPSNWEELDRLRRYWPSTR
jgi:hypothetical protein